MRVFYFIFGVFLFFVSWSNGSHQGADIITAGLCIAGAIVIHASAVYRDEKQSTDSKNSTD